MTSAELTHWMAYSRVRPIGEEADDWRMAISAALGLSAWGGKATAAECLPDWWGERKGAGRHMSVDESVAWARTVAGG